jgi:SpoVK/Ycf46/Vps4 family AAA+-type ATPase
MLNQFKAARRAAVPIIAIETADQQALVREISKCNENVPVVQWNIINGLVPVNQLGAELVNNICAGDDPAMVTGNPVEMLSKIVKAPEKTIVFMSNMHRFLSEAAISQGICNLRDVFKSSGATLVMLAPSFVLPTELEQDVMILTEKLPDEEAIKEIIRSIQQDAGIQKINDEDKIADTLIGLSAFCAEQTLATCVKKENDEIVIDSKLLWERKCKAVEQTPGLSIWRGSESFEDVGGCDNVKEFTKAVIGGKDHPRAIVFMDEIEKSFAGSGSDSSGVSQDQLGAILSFMQDKEVDGMIFVGPPGAAKSAVAKSAGNCGNIPTISFDLGAMKNSLVGKSGEQTRKALQVIEAISKGRVLFIATCNNITTLPPELRRRFTMGTFFFDLPTKDERKKIWDIYIAKYDVKDRSVPTDEGWTGAEIKQCCKLSSKLNIKLTEAAKYIVPVAKSAAEQIDALRRLASGKFISANTKGIYSMNTISVQQTSSRKFE